MQADIQALSLTGIGTNVVLMKLPAVEEEIDTLPIIAIVPAATPEEIRPASFENQVNKVFSVEIVAIVKNKKLLALDGNTDANQDWYRHSEWREKIARAFYLPSSISDVDGVWKTEIKPGAPVDRGQVNANYDYYSMTINFHVMETGIN